MGVTNIFKDDICKHFECFGKQRSEINNIEDELCHHTYCSEWEFSVWPLLEGDLEVECAKKIIELESLASKAKQNGLNKKLYFTSSNSFDKFWEWFCP